MKLSKSPVSTAQRCDGGGFQRPTKERLNLSKTKKELSDFSNRNQIALYSWIILKCCHFVVTKHFFKAKNQCLCGFAEFRTSFPLLPEYIFLLLFPPNRMGIMLIGSSFFAQNGWFSAHSTASEKISGSNRGHGLLGLLLA